MTDTPTISTPHVRSGLIGRIVAIGVAALLSTLVGALAVVVFLFVVTLPASIYAVFNPQIFVLALSYAAVWAAPITLVLLPVTAIFLERGIPAMIILPIVGMIGGGLSVWIWDSFTGSGELKGLVFSLVTVVGAIAGLAAGGCFGRTLYELGK